MTKRTNSLNTPKAFWRRSPALSAVPCITSANVMQATPARRAVLGEGGEVGSMACNVSAEATMSNAYVAEKDVIHIHSPNTDTEAACHPYCQIPVSMRGRLGGIGSTLTVHTAYMAYMHVASNLGRRYMNSK